MRFRFTALCPIPLSMNGNGRFDQRPGPAPALTSKTSAAPLPGLMALSLWDHVTQAPPLPGRHETVLRPARESERPDGCDHVPAGVRSNRVPPYVREMQHPFCVSVRTTWPTATQRPPTSHEISLSCWAKLLVAFGLVSRDHAVPFHLRTRVSPGVELDWPTARQNVADVQVTALRDPTTPSGSATVVRAVPFQCLAEYG
jgi:hypothetical protein